MDLPEQPQVKTPDGQALLRYFNSFVIVVGAAMAFKINGMIDEGQKESKRAISSLDSKFTALDKAQAITEANRYSSNDHIKFADQIHAELTLQDKRVTRIEDSQNEIKSGISSLKESMTVLKAANGIPLNGRE